MKRRREAFRQYARTHDDRLKITEARQTLMDQGLYGTVEQYRNQSYKLVKSMPEFVPETPGEFRLVSLARPAATDEDIQQLFPQLADSQRTGVGSGNKEAVAGLKVLAGHQPATAGKEVFNGLGGLAS